MSRELICPYTDRLDGRAHLVTEVEAGAGISEGKGRYRALCGYVVTAMPMIVPNGMGCHDCLALLRARFGSERRRVPKRRWPTLLTCLFGSKRRETSDGVPGDRASGLHRRAQALVPQGKS